MPLDDLVGVIETLKERIQSRRSDLQANEIRTRMALIDPLLTALGWDTGDPALVLPEYALKGQRADYALLKPDGKPAAFVEAKKLDESLASHRMQMVNYANLAGVPYAGLTDGNYWELYRVFDQRPIEERRIVNVSIAQKPVYESALQLLRLWRPNMASGQPLPAGEPLFTKEPAVPPNPPLPIPAAPNASNQVTLGAYDPQQASKPPSAIRFPDGSARDIRYWWQLAAFTAEWLWSKGRLTADHIPCGLTKGTYILNTEAVHPSGKPFLNPRTINGMPFAIEAHGSKIQSVAKTKFLMERCDVNPADVHLEEQSAQA